MNHAFCTRRRMRIERIRMVITIRRQMRMLTNRNPLNIPVRAFSLFMVRGIR